MKCPECEFENVDGSRFCRNCGSPLPKVAGSSGVWDSQEMGSKGHGDSARSGTGSGAGASVGSGTSSSSGSSSSRRGSSQGGSRAKHIRPGMRLGSYEVQNEIGKGAMARVWRARDTRLQRDVAIKEPVFQSGIDAATRAELGRRFVGEGRTAARLNHPNIVSIYSAEVLEGMPVIVMELIEGETLSQMMARGPMAPGVALSILDELLDAVGYAHSQGVIHRDIKPDNVFITSSGKVKLGDFGIAHVENGGVPRLTNAGTVLGTPGYMSPEQAMGNPVDERSDLFSVGVLAYEMLSGKNPFGADQGVSTATLLYRIVHEPAPELPQNISGALPYDLRGGIMAALEKDPYARPQTAAGLKRMLHTAPVRGTASYGVPPVAPAPQPQQVQQQAKGSSSTKVLGAVVAVLAICLAGLLVVALPRIFNTGGSVGESSGDTTSSVGDSSTSGDSSEGGSTETSDSSVDEGISGVSGDTIGDVEYDDAAEQEAEPEPEPEPVYSEPNYSSASCSSYRPYDGYSNYGPELAVDNNANTAWNEGASDDGIGEYISLEGNGTQYVRGLDIRNGYQKVSDKYPNGELFGYNNRPSRVTVYLADGYTQSFDLQDATGWQRIDFGSVHETTYVRISIDSVYKGSKWSDTCISDIHAYANIENSWS